MKFGGFIRWFITKFVVIPGLTSQRFVFLSGAKSRMKTRPLRNEEALASNEPANSEAVNAEETVPPGQTVLCFQMARTTSPSHQEG